MAKQATLAIRIVSDASKAGKGFAEAESKTAKFESGMGKATAASGLLLAGIGAVAKEAFDSASRLQQAGGAVESVFGKQATAVDKLAKTAADRVGLATSSYSELSSTLGSQLKGMGFAGDQLVAKNEALITTGADLAATFGGDTSEAVSALSSLLRGERDPIERYGIAISQASVDAKVAALGLDTSTEAAKRNAQAQATLALVADQSAGAQGAFARESDTAAGAQQRASANFENAKAALGEVLLPVVTEAATKFSELTTFLVAHKDTVTIVVGVIASLAAGIMIMNAAVSAYKGIATAAKVAQFAWNVAMAANPIGLVVLAIAAVVAAVVIAYNKFDSVKTIVDAVGRALKSAFEGAKSAIQWVLDKLKSIADNPLTNAIGGLFGAPAVAPVPAGGPPPAAGAPGVYGASALAVPGVYGAGMTSRSALSGGRSLTRQGAPVHQVVVHVHEAIDPIATGKTVERVLKKYATSRGAKVAVKVSRDRQAIRGVAR